MKRLAKIVWASAFLGGLATWVWASRIESRRYRLEKVTAEGPKGWLTVGQAGGVSAEPVRILHLSDLHLAGDESHKLEFIQAITADRYDLVVLTGDIFENDQALSYAGSLLRRQPTLGAFAVLGNHDYYSYSMIHKTWGRIDRRYRHPACKRDVSPLILALEAGGFRVLRNEAVSFPDRRLHLIGVDYPGIGLEALEQLAAQVEDDWYRLSIFHLPVNLDYYAQARVDLALCGHTHGGQIRIPGIGALITDSELPRHEASGMVRRGETLIHVSRGLGADPRTNFRLFCPPAATVIEVVPAGAFPGTLSQARAGVTESADRSRRAGHV